MVTFACTAADGRCRRLPGSTISEGLPFLPSDAFGQFFDFVPSSELGIGYLRYAWGWCDACGDR